MVKKVKKQPDEMTLANEERAFKMRSQGMTQQSIAKELGFCQGAVSRILSRVNRKYTKLFMNQVADIKAEQVAIHNQMVEEALIAWQQSKGLHMVKKNKVKGVMTLDGKQRAVGGDNSEETKQLFGDTKYLDTSMKAMEHIRKIVGIGSEDEEAERDPVYGKVEFTIVDKRSLEDNENGKAGV